MCAYGILSPHYLQTKQLVTHKREEIEKEK